MGGIKNKLSKLIHEPPFRKRRQMKSGRISIGGFDRLVRITKYTSLACLANMASSSDVAALANLSSLSISFSNATGSCTDTSNPANVCMEIPDGGGMATGGHTVTIAAYGVGWRLGFGSGTDSGLSNGDFSIPSIDSASVVAELPNNTWGYGEWSDGHEFAGYQKVSSTGLSQTIFYVYGGDRSPARQHTNDIHIQYGVRVDRPGQMLAGNYSANVVYLLEPQLIPGPQIDSITPTDYTIDSGDATAVIQGDYLATTYDIYMERDGIKYSLKDSVASVEMRRISFTIPANGIQPGGYTIHVVTQGGEATTQFEYKEKPVPVGSVCANADSSSACVVDMDANMIPIYYTGDDNSPEWTSLSDDDIQNTPSAWYNYGEKKWANAVTVKPEALTKYKDQHTKIDENDVLGYWVYIPRYAYKVMRKEVTDKVVIDEEAKAMGGFDIRFETNEDFKRTPKSCSTSSSSRYYQDCVDTTYPTEERLANQTAWATHPAFSWGSKELNGFWIGKFEATGTASNPTVLPNEKHIGDTNEYTSGISNVNGEGVGIYYDIAKIVGKEDVNNSGGNGNEFAKPNQHNFQDYSSHVLKNSEWGAATYLASSVYGAGIGEVRNNGNTTDYGAPNDSSYGITGCGPEAIEDTGKSYQDFGAIGEADACGDLDHGYNGKIGVLASTTGNVYGVYDMAGGVYEFVAGVYSENNVNYSDTDLHPFFVDPISEPYADLYRARDFLAPVRDSYGNNNYCTWSTCGGDATYETKNVQSVVSVGLGEGSSWANDSSMFVQPGNTMLMRGGYGDGADDGIYSAYLYPGSFGYTGANYGFRIGLHNLK